MGRKQNSVNMDRKSFYKDLNDDHNPRLARHMHRRLAASNNYKNQNLSVNTVKRTVDHVQNGEGLVDPCHAKYANEDGCSEDHFADDEEDNDPEYRMCLQHLREDAKSYVLEMTINVMRLHVKYEEENELDDDLKRKSSKDVSSEDKVEVEQVWRNITHEEKKKTPLTLGSASSKGRKISVVEKDAKADCRENGRLSQKRKPESKHDMGSYKVNEIYKEFLNCLKKLGDTFVLVTEDGKYVRYEEDVDSSSDSDSEVVVTGYRNKTSGRGSSKFREKLMSILRMPFDQQQYEALLQAASERKPIHGHRRLRSVEKTYATKKMGESYLDLYTGLENKIYSVRHNHHSVFNLLRGFFFWLQNLSQEGAFPPWLDESCLKLM